MSEKNRIFGNNLRVFLKEKNLCSEALAAQLGYSMQELLRIMDARLFLTTEEKENIARALDVTLDDMYQVQSNQRYQSAGCLECRGEFSRPENKKKILDLFDIYCDIQEVLSMENLKELSMKPSI